MSAIAEIIAREILDSRGNPTVEVEVELLSGATGRAAVPSGASTGADEAVELRDGGDRYLGRGVRTAVQHVSTEIAEVVIGLDADDQRLLDDQLCMLDGTPNKARLGANVILGVSLAVADAAAAEAELPLYRYVGGAQRARAADAAHERAQRRCPRRLERRHPGVHARPGRCRSFSEALRWSVEVYHTLRSVLHERGLNTVLGDEGGFAPDLPSNEDALKLLVEAIEKAGRTSDEVAVAVDVAVHRVYRDGTYVLEGEGRSYSSQDWADELAGL